MTADRYVPQRPSRPTNAQPPPRRPQRIRIQVAQAPSSAGRYRLGNNTRLPRPASQTSRKPRRVQPLATRGSSPATRRMPPQLPGWLLKARGCLPRARTRISSQGIRPGCCSPAPKASAVSGKRQEARLSRVRGCAKEAQAPDSKRLKVDRASCGVIPVARPRENGPRSTVKPTAQKRRADEEDDAVGGPIGDVGTATETEEEHTRRHSGPDRLDDCARCRPGPHELLRWQTRFQHICCQTFRLSLCIVLIGKPALGTFEIASI